MKKLLLITGKNTPKKYKYTISREIMVINMKITMKRVVVSHASF